MRVRLRLRPLRFVRQWRYAFHSQAARPRLRRVRHRQLALGLRLLLRQDRAGRDVVRAHGALPLPLRDGRSGAAARDASTGSDCKGVGRSRRRLVPRRSCPVPDPVLRTLAHHRLARRSDGGHHAGHSRRRSDPLRARAPGRSWLACAGCLDCRRCSDRARPSRHRELASPRWPAIC